MVIITFTYVYIHLHLIRIPAYGFLPGGGHHAGDSARGPAGEGAGEPSGDEQALSPVMEAARASHAALSFCPRGEGGENIPATLLQRLAGLPVVKTT